ncbi:hypothetical protein DAETH_23820 [Deinococcus aetherius]|uniref:Uncharacterized protein n=2 Tax=Deinococcus aetherius TaxID=200252 RepID=A0ABM8AF32_9DEIO|nr:hypothetical protein DAETH_23820 [Deinococcus aetherius]
MMLDADTAGLLLRLSRSEGAADALTLHLLRESQGRLAGVVRGLSGECRDYFEELGDLVLLALEHARAGLL